MVALEALDLHGLSDLTAEQLVQRIWALGPRNCGTNILLNLSDYEQPDFWSTLSRSSDTDVRSAADARRDFNSSLVNGFQLTSGAGPLCEEPMQGVCFAVLEWSVQAEGEDLNARGFGPFSGGTGGKCNIGLSVIYTYTCSLHRSSPHCCQGGLSSGIPAAAAAPCDAHVQLQHCGEC